VAAVLLRSHDRNTPHDAPAGLVLVIEERGDALARIVGGARRQDEMRSRGRAGDEPLAAVDLPGAARLLGVGLDHARIGAAAGFAAAAAFIVALTVVWATTFDIGILGDPSLPVTQRILVAQSSILTASFCALVLAALFAERKANELRLARSNLMLERERDNKLMNMQAVTAAMAHELKQPLTAISANSEAVQMVLGHTKPDRTAMRSALDSIVEDSHRAGRILNDIRALFLKTDSEYEFIDVNEVASGVLRLLQEELKEHGVVVRAELTPDLPRVMGHKGQLQEVLVNLVQNAVEAMGTIRAGRRRLWLKTERHGDDAIVVEVKDSGPGIDPANLNGIFDAFFTTKSQGTGLGLAICRMIIERHGGQLSASSDGTHGALFLFVLPARSASADVVSPD